MISVIIPTLNEEEHIGAILDFLKDHPLQDQFEVIVVDGNSTDRTLSIVNSYNVFPCSTEHCSRALQMNIGARHAKGDILYFVHADVKLIPSFVDDIIDAIRRGFVSGCYRFKFDHPRNPLLHINGFFTRFPFKWCRGGDQTLFISKEAFDEIGGFDERYVIMEDYDLLDRLEHKGMSFKVIPKSVKVSARKYLSNSYLKVQMTNLKAMKMYKRGVSPHAIKNFYAQALD